MCYSCGKMEDALGTCSHEHDQIRSVCRQLPPRLPHVLRLKQRSPNLPPCCLYTLRCAPRSKSLLVLADLVPKMLDDLATTFDLGI